MQRCCLCARLVSRIPTIKLKVYTKLCTRMDSQTVCILRGNDFYVIIIMQFFMKKFMFAVRGAANTELNSIRPRPSYKIYIYRMQ